VKEIKMAKLLEQVLAIKLSKIVKDYDSQESVLNEDQLETLLASIPELAESILTGEGIVVETLELK
jgi:hypothetical protein